MNIALLCWGLLFLTNHMTEVSQNTPLNTSGGKLSIMDKYFSFKKEQRINRTQFFVRNITGILIGWAPIALIGILIFTGQQFGIIRVVKDGEPFPIEASITVGVVMILSIAIYYILCINNCKRAHDFNHQGIWYNLMFYIGIFLIWLWVGILIFLWVLMMGWDGMIWATIAFIWWYVSIYIAQLVTWWILQFRKWNPGNNQYGPAPTGKPLV